jgi:predicted transcriptional regulator of viral defense system
LPDKTPSKEHLLSKLLPESIVCLESALYHYGYNDYAPTSWSIAVPRTISLSKLKIEGLPLVPHFIPASNYALGKMQSNFNSYILNVYDRERTISCDVLWFPFSNIAKTDFRYNLNTFTDKSD